LCFLSFVFVCGVCFVFVGICRYINRISCFWMVFLLDYFVVWHVVKAFCFLLEEESKLEHVWRLDMSSVFWTLSSPYEGFRHAAAKRICHACICLSMYKTTSLSIRISAVFAWFWCCSDIPSHVHSSWGVLWYFPYQSEWTGRFLQIQRLKRHVQNVQNVGSDVKRRKNPQGEHEYVRQRKLKPAEPRFGAKDDSCRETKTYTLT